jgi:homoserine kinase
LRAAHAVFEEVGTPYPGFQMRASNNVPFGRGLGSSATAIACGLLIANHCLRQPLPSWALLDLANRLEGHPDNVAPCLLGGVQVATTDARGHVLHAAIPLALPLHAVAFVPEAEIPTLHARGILPPSVPLDDARFNVARSSLLVAALYSGQLELLAEATQDRLHQPYRRPLFPAGATLCEAAMAAGALGAFISGAGPTVLAFVLDDASDQAVSAAFSAAAAEHNVTGSVLNLALSQRGAHVVG